MTQLSHRLILLCIAFYGAGIMSCKQSSNGAGSPRAVSVYLPGSPTQVSGMKLAVTNGIGIGDCMEPQQIDIHAPDGTVFSMAARSSSVQVSENVVAGVYVRRPLEPVRSLAAKADLLNTLAALHIEPDRGMREDMAFWTTDAAGVGEVPGVMPYSEKTGIRTPFHGLALDVQLSPDPAGGWYYLLIFTAVTADSVPALSPATQPATQPSSGREDISVRLSGTAADVTGARVDARTVGMDEADLWQARKLSLALPDGHTITVAAYSANLMFFDGIIHGVFIRSPQAASFAQAKADLLRTLAELRIKAEDVTRRMMADWEKGVPSGKEPGREHDYQAGFNQPIHGSELTIRICPDADGGWYSFLIFSVGSAHGIPVAVPPRGAAASRPH